MAFVLVALLLGSRPGALRAAGREHPKYPSSGKPVTGQGTSFPSPSPARVSKPIPLWVYIAGLLASFAGAEGFSCAPEGLNLPNVLSLALIPGGLAFIFGAALYYGDSAERRNARRGAGALLSWFLMGGGAMLFVFIKAGAFAPGQGRFYGALAGFLFAAGMAGFYFGLKYQQSAEGRDIGRELGFSDADGGISDGFYDSKGVINGLAALFKIEHETGYGNVPAHFMLEVLCRCPNSLGAKLSVKPEGVPGSLGLSFASLPRVPDVPYWDFYNVHSDQPEAVLRLLPEARRKSNVFNDKTGFLGMSLEGSEFKFTFELKGYPETDYVRRVLQETSGLASRFL